MFPGGGPAVETVREGTGICAALSLLPCHLLTWPLPSLLAATQEGSKLGGFTLCVQERQEKAACKPPPTPEARARSLVRIG